MLFLIRFREQTALIVLANLASSLGHKLERDPSFLDVSCLTCARILARTYASIVKLFSGIVERQSLKAAKRQTNTRSPTGDILLLQSVLTRTQEIYRNRPANHGVLCPLAERQVVMTKVRWEYRSFVAKSILPLISTENSH